jgi:hypothetical protein
VETPVREEEGKWRVVMNGVCVSDEEVYIEDKGKVSCCCVDV